MSNTDRDHFYYVDPGIGEKQQGCPYSFYKDGHDVRSFITPPDGYELTEFKFEAYPDDLFYDGKIVAQYKKIPFSVILKKNFWKYLLVFLAIIGLLTAAVLGFRFVKQHKNGIMRRLKIKPKTEIKAQPVNKTKQGRIADSTKVKVVKIEKTNTEVAATENFVEQDVTPIKDKIVETKGNETVTQPENVSNSNQESNQATNLTTEQFQQEFWDLIHRKARQMGTYGDLYRKYKDANINCREFSYLYSTILENNYAFDVWKDKMIQIPEDEIRSINSINTLKQEIDLYEDEESQE